jgi:hypothetical protein
LALGCATTFSELKGRCRRRERVAVAGPPSLLEGENMMNNYVKLEDSKTVLGGWRE